MKNRAFTLMELIIVLIIIGILSTLGISYFDPMRESALDNEARANARLIIAAQRTRRMETGTFYQTPVGTTNDEGAINTNLRLLLPTANRNWNYITRDTTAGSVACAQATRNATSGRSWCLRSNQADPVRSTCAAGCP